MVRRLAGHKGQQWVSLPGAPVVLQDFFDGIQTVMVAVKQLRGAVFRGRGGIAPSGFHKNGVETLDGPEISVSTDVEELGEVERVKEGKLDPGVIGVDVEGESSRDTGSQDIRGGDGLEETDRIIFGDHAHLLGGAW